MPLTAVLAQAASAPELKKDLTQIRDETVTVAAYMWRVLADWGLRVVGVVLILLGAWIVAGWARRTLYRVINRPHFDQTLVRFLSNLARWAILIIGLVASLSLFGIAPTSLAAIVGAAGIAVGLALQGSLSNLAAGIMLLLLRPFKVGDTVAVSGVTGVVDDIELFHTKFDTGDNRRVIVPNGQIFGSVIENLTHHGKRSVSVKAVVEFAADVDRTREVLLSAARSVAGAGGGLADPAPAVTLADLGAAGMEWQVVVWSPTDKLGDVRQAVVRAVKAGLDEAGIGIAVPRMELRRGEGDPRAGHGGGGGG